MLRSIVIILIFAVIGYAHTIQSSKKSQKDFPADSVPAPATIAGATSKEHIRKHDLSSCAFSQPIPNLRSPKLTGNLSEDLLSSISGKVYRDSLDAMNTRAALTSGFFSFVIPGAGQLYNGGTPNYIKAAAFFGLEAAGWIVDVLWNKKGDQETKAFQVYADGTAADGYRNGHYSVYRYAQWIGGNVQQLEQINGTSSQGQAIIAKYINANGNSLLRNQYASPEYQVNWYALNAVENAMGGYFSHWLFAYPGVEYYKEIGKYPQFRQGWVDETPAILDYNSIRVDTPNSYYYENMRGTATHYYNVALVAAGVLILNHFASGVEAAIWAHGHYRPVETSIGVSPLPQGVGYQTDFDLALNF
ncbi:MAG: hypothetical protein M1469_11680 [Bacteroidetes bacterium]|nr:hypothetical protein [Bacteroidota bacterium]